MAPPISQLNAEAVILVPKPPEPLKPATPELDKTIPSKSVDKLAGLEQSRAGEVRESWVRNITDVLDCTQGFAEGFNAFTVVKDIASDFLGIKYSQQYWEGRTDGARAAMVLDLLTMGGGIVTSLGSVECLATTAGFCFPVAGPGFAIGGAVALAGAGLYGVHHGNLEKAKEQYSESRAKDPSSSSRATDTPPEPRKINPSKAESPVWKEMKPFREDIKTNGLTGKKIEYYKWDHTHQEIEVYGANRMHKGVKDPLTGEIIKDAVPGRRIKF